MRGAGPAEKRLAPLISRFTGTRAESSASEFRERTRGAERAWNGGFSRWENPSLHRVRPSKKVRGRDFRRGVFRRAREIREEEQNERMESGRMSVGSTRKRRVLMDVFHVGASAPK